MASPSKNSGLNSKLLNIDTGILNKNACIVLVKTEWNAGIVDELEKGCLSELKKYDIKKVKAAMTATFTSLKTSFSVFINHTLSHCSSATPSYPHSLGVPS